MCKIRGIGLDLCAISRMEEQLGNQKLMARCFTPNEQAYIFARGLTASSSMAAMWAAKEAAGKALGCGIAFPMTDVEVLHDQSGQPVYRLHGRALELARGGELLLSISHESDMAAAVCIWSV